MALDNMIFPLPFRLSSRDSAKVTNFQVAAFESGKRAGGKLTKSILSAGTTVLRNVKDEYGKTGDQARTVPPSASKNTGVRWSGLIQDTNIGKGALYTSLDMKGFLNEARRHARTAVTRTIPWLGSSNGEAQYTVFGPTTKDYGQLLVGHAYYVFKLKHPITLVNLTPSSNSEFYSTIEASRDYQLAKRDLGVQAPLWRIASDPVDYTGSRPLGLSALLGSNVEGLRVESAQDEVSEIAGSATNIVLAGEDGKQIDFLEPMGKLVAGTSEGRPALLEIKLNHGTTDRGSVLPGSVLPTGAAESDKT